MTGAPPEHLANPVTRRAMLRAAALGGAALMLPGFLTACRDDLPDPTQPGGATKGGPIRYGDGGGWAFIGQISITAYNFAPRGWALCNGQLLPISGNQALFALLGTTYGGNGLMNFALPDLRGRTAICAADMFFLGQRAGEEFHTLTEGEMPQHLHQLMASTADATVNIPTGNQLGQANNLYSRDVLVDPDSLASLDHAARASLALTPAPANMYSSPGALVGINTDTVSARGGNQPHENRQPFTVLSFCIALQGIFPSRN
jgi:microcystin-dependent protein